MSQSLQQPPATPECHHRNWQPCVRQQYPTWSEFAYCGITTNLLNAVVWQQGGTHFLDPLSPGSARHILGRAFSSLADLMEIGEASTDGLASAEFVLSANALRDLHPIALLSPEFAPLWEAEEFAVVVSEGRIRRAAIWGQFAEAVIVSALKLQQWRDEPALSIRRVRLCALGCGTESMPVILDLRVYRGRLKATCAIGSVPHFTAALNRLWAGSSSIDEQRVRKSLDELRRRAVGTKETIAA